LGGSAGWIEAKDDAERSCGSKCGESGEKANDEEKIKVKLKTN
jgi:hypothetical protein